MIDKIDSIKKVLTIILFVLITAGIIFGLIKLIISASKGVDLITPEEVCLYTINDNLVTDYSKFNFIEACVKNISESCKQEKYNELLKLYIKDYSEQYTKVEKQEKLKLLTNAKECKLEKLYKIDTKYNRYIAEISLDGSLIYLLISNENTKNYSYTFAFLK